MGSLFEVHKVFFHNLRNYLLFEVFFSSSPKKWENISPKGKILKSVKKEKKFSREKMDYLFSPSILEKIDMTDLNLGKVFLSF